MLGEIKNKLKKAVLKNSYRYISRISDLKMIPSISYEILFPSAKIEKMSIYDKGIYLSRVFDANNVYVNCELCPARVRDDKKFADLINRLYTDGFRESGEQDENQYTLLNDIIASIASEKGIVVPKIGVTYNRVNAGGYASMQNEITIVGAIRGDEYDKNAGHSFPFLLDMFGHETQHLKQFASIKAFFNGEEVEDKYAIMAMINFMDISAGQDENANVFERITKHLRGDSYIYNSNYFYNIMELDARISACDFVIDLLDNPDLCDGVRIEIENYLQNTACAELHLYNSGKNFKKAFYNRVEKFEKKYSEVEYGDAILKYIDRLEPFVGEYASFLDNYERNIQKRIDLAINKSKEIRETSIQENNEMNM